MAADTKATRKRRKVTKERKDRCERWGRGSGVLIASQGMVEAMMEAEARKLERAKEGRKP